MKIEFLSAGSAATRSFPRATPCFVEGETDRLTDVLLCAPSYLAPVPCCSVTREQLRDGHATSRAEAAVQHRALRGALEAAGVTCHMLAPAPDMPDLSFTRDVAVSTPWGLVALNPALPHRRREVDQVLAAAERLGIEPFARIEQGTVEGGDVCIARPGLLIVGCSGERTNETGVEAFAAPFRAEGWDVVTCAYDPHFLHLDTMFCMLDERQALACVDVLSDTFLAGVAARGIELLPVSYKESRRLGCNVVSLDGRTVLMSAGHDRVAGMLRGAGFVPVELDVSEFSACGGGIHCLTMPLARASGSAR